MFPLFAYITLSLFSLFFAWVEVAQTIVSISEFNSTMRNLHVIILVLHILFAIIFGVKAWATGLTLFSN